MRGLRQLKSVNALAILALFLASQSSRAGTITGTFQGVGLVEVTPYVKGEPATPAFYSNVPSTINFTLASDGSGTPTPIDYLALNLTNNIYSLDTSEIAFNRIFTVPSLRRSRTEFRVRVLIPPSVF